MMKSFFGILLLLISTKDFAVGVLTGPAKDPSPQTGTVNWVRSDNASMSNLTVSNSLSSTGVTYIGNDSTQFNGGGQLGIKTALSSWGSSIAAVQLYPGASAVIYSNGDGNEGANFGSNVYFTGSLDKFISTGFATKIRQKAGAYDFYSSTTSGTAGGTITWNSPSLSIAQDGTITGVGVSGFTTAANTQTLTNKSISGSTNTLSNIGNSSLTNSSVTVGSTSIALGATGATIAGLTLTTPNIGAATGTSVSLSGSSYTLGTLSVGTSTPGATLFVHAATNDNFELLTTNSGIGIRLFVRKDDGSIAANRFEVQTATTAFVSSNGVDKLTVDHATGNITSSGNISTTGVTYVASNPTPSSCGTSPSVDAGSSNYSGRVTVGTVAATGCTITFATAFTTKNHCIVTSQGIVTSFAYSYTLSAITVTATGIVGDILDYSCDGY